MDSRLKRHLRFAGGAVLLSVTCGLLAACGQRNAAGSANQASSSTNFTAFVKAQLQQPGTAQPADVNGVNFDFTDLNNPNAYNDVLPPQSSSGG